MTRDAGLRTNILANALGQMAFVVSGFVVPRLIHDRLDLEMLGIWDLTWSLVAHLMLVGAGAMSAVSRDVARFPATGDADALSRLLTSCLVLFWGLGALVAALTLAFAALLPLALPTITPERIPEARGVVAIVGLATALRFPFHVFNGVITGLQRFVLHNVILAGCYLGGVAVGVALVFAGSGLTGMAVGYLLGEVASGLLKLLAARRICPPWRIAPRFLSLDAIRHVFGFGGKTLLSTASRVLLFQTNALLVGRFLGVEALAVFARSRSLVMLLDAFVQRIVAVFTPRASEADARGDREALVHTLHRAHEVSLFAVLPGVVALVVLGGPILELWMGPSFAVAALLTTLAAGQLPMLAQRGTVYVLIGMGRHGWTSLVDLAAAVVAITLSLLFLGPMNLGLIGAALAIVVPLTISNWLFTPLYTCRLLNLSVAEFLWSAARRPLIAAAPAALVFLAFRLLADVPLAVRVFGGIGIGGAAYLLMYAVIAVDADTRRRWLGRISRSVGTGREATRPTDAGIAKGR